MRPTLLSTKFSYYATGLTSFGFYQKRCPNLRAYSPHLLHQRRHHRNPPFAPTHRLVVLGVAGDEDGLGRVDGGDGAHAGGEFLQVFLEGFGRAEGGGVDGEEEVAGFVARHAGAGGRRHVLGAHGPDGSPELVEADGLEQDGRRVVQVDARDRRGFLGAGDEDHARADLFVDFERRVHAVPAALQADIHQDDPGLVAARHGRCLVGRGGGAADGEAHPLDHRDEEVGDEELVLDDEDGGG